MADNELEAIFELGEEQEFDCEFTIDAVTFDYEQLDKKPQINGETLIGNKTSEELHLASSQSIIDVNNRIDGIVESFDGDIERLEQNINTLDEKVDGINANLTQQIEETQQDVNDKYNELVNDIDNLSTTVEESVVALQQEDTALQNQINTQNQTLTNHNTRITANANAIAQEIIDRQNADDALSDRIDAVESRGRFLALWNATTGLPESTPQITPYTYKTGDYYIVDAVGEINYRPTGTEFVEGQPSTEIETEELTTDDVYYYDGAVWRLQVNHGKTVSFGNLTGQPSDNTALKQALDSKQPTGNYAVKDNTNVFTAPQKMQSGNASGSLILGANVASNILTNGVRKLGRLAMPLQEDSSKTMLLFGGDTSGDANSTIGQTSNVIPINRVEFGGRLGATSVTAPDGIAFTVAKNHNATAEIDKVYALEMNASQVRFNVQPNYNGVKLATVNDLATKQNITDNNLVTTAKTVVGAVNELDTKIKDIQLYKFPNAIIIGQPTINNGQISGFSQQNYLTLPFLFDVGDRAFELNYAFRTGDNVTTAQNLFGSNYCIASYIQNGKLNVRVSSNGTSWDVVSLETSLNVLPNTVYYIKIAFNKLNYTISASTDGTTYNQIGYVVNTKKPIAGNVFIGIGNNQNNPFLGVINLNRWDIRLNNSIIWEGMDDVGLATRADISLSNLDEQGEARFTNLKNQFISFLDSQNLTDEQKALAKQNIDASRITNRVIDRTWTYANFNLYGTYGRTEVWTVATKEGLIVGDVFTINVTISDRNNAKGYILVQISDLQSGLASSVRGVTLLSATSFVPDMATKQDIISDLSTIRSNASTGAGLAPQVAVNTQRIEDLTTARIPDVIYHGTPKITGGQVSNFSTVNYLQFPFEDISRSLPFDIYFSFTTSDDVTTQQNIIDSHFGIAIAIQNGKGVMALSSNGTSWDIGSVTGTNTLLSNTTYYVKYSWTGTEYNASLSTNDQTYVPDMILQSNKSPYKTTIYIGGCDQQKTGHTPHPFKGIINFTKSRVVVNGITVWEGMADVGIASRANVSLNNLDEIGEARFTSKQDVLDITLLEGAVL